MENKAIQFLGSQRNGKVNFTNNIYVNHYNKSGVFKVDETKYYDFAGWKVSTAQDANSTINVVALATGETDVIFYNDTKQSKEFNLGNTIYKDINGKQVSDKVSLLPLHR